MKTNKFIQKNQIKRLIINTLFIVTGLVMVTCGGVDYSTAVSPLDTKFASQVNPENPLPEYPRPQMVREEWKNLNGIWKYTIDSVNFFPVKGLTKAKSWTSHPVPEQWKGEILVPFAIDAPLSGVGHVLRPDEILWYEKTFRLPASWNGKNILLHFQASDWETSVYINGTKVGQHRGGYDPFSFDITEALDKGKNTIHVCVWDATGQQAQAIGKQIMPENRRGHRYQPTGGIWQTVWLEPVPENHIQHIRITPDLKAGRVYVNTRTSGQKGDISIQVKDQDKVVATATGRPNETIAIPIENPKPWNTENPFLYDLRIGLRENGNLRDEITSYFGLRDIAIRKAPDGHVRIFLNDRELFQYGPLDQGYWPNGGLTPPSEEAIKFDLEYLKDIRCNMVRVHIKTHPERWYYWADKLGILVWQDMICMPKYGQEVDNDAADQWFGEFKNMVDWLYNHPSVVHWIIFNEGWSQHGTGFYANWLKEEDSTRLVTAASGWYDKPYGDVMDVHDYTYYPRNNVEDYKLEGKRALVIGEAGGVNLAIPGHTWYSEDNPPEMEYQETYTPVDDYHFRKETGRDTYSSPEIYETAYRQFTETIRWHHAGSGCNALVYTQITDVEHELNGWLTYDRNISKIPVQTMAEIHRKVYEKPVIKPILPFRSAWNIKNSGFQETLLEPDYDFSTWKKVSMPAGATNIYFKQTEKMTPPFVAQTAFELDAIPKKAAFSVKGFSPCSIYLNGELMFESKIGARFDEPGIDFYPLMEDQLKKLKIGKNNVIIVVREQRKTDLIDVGFFSAG